MEMKAEEGQLSQGHCRSARRPTSYGEPAKVLHRARQVADPEKDQANDAPDNGACGLISDGGQHDGPSQDMAAHAENQEDDLSGAEELASKVGKA